MELYLSLKQIRLRQPEFLCNGGDGDDILLPLKQVHWFLLRSHLWLVIFLSFMVGDLSTFSFCASRRISYSKYIRSTSPLMLHFHIGDAVPFMYVLSEILGFLISLIISCASYVLSGTSLPEDNLSGIISRTTFSHYHLCSHTVLEVHFHLETYRNSSSHPHLSSRCV